MKYYRLTILFSFFILLINSSNTFSQNIKESTFRFFKSAQLSEIDQYGFIYSIDKDNLIKYDSKGEILYNYSNKLLGDITQIDISNPLRPLLFYKDQGVIFSLRQYTVATEKSNLLMN